MKILLVEDNDIDVILFRRALSSAGLDCQVVRARDGIEALEILTGTHGSDSIEDPFVILLDINMPRMNGHDFLTALRAKDQLARSQVIVVTTSDDPKDINLAYDNQVSGYLVKPVSTREMTRAVESMHQFLDMCKLPSTSLGLT